MIKSLHPDPLILICIVILTSLGLAVLSSVMPSLFLSQLVFVGIGLIFYIFFSSIDFKLFFVYAKVIYVLSVIFLLITVLIGFVSRGAARWVDVFGFRFQFSELLKPFVVASFAQFMVDIKDPTRRLVIGILLAVPIALLIFRQPDLGSAIVYVMTFISIIIASRANPKLLVILSLIGVALLPVFWGALAEYQRLRIISFINPGHDLLGSSYNAIQSVITVGSGMMWGQGLGRGTQTHLFFLPEKHTDFIFASFAEEFGFVGSTFLLVVYFILFVRIIFVLRQSTDFRSKLVLLGILMILLTQVFINVGMNIGLLPITGITLPLVSYGGSSLVGTMIALGIVSNIAWQEKQAGLF